MTGTNPISRRALLGTAAALPFVARAQQNPPGAGDEFNAAVERQRSYFEEMKKTALPMSVEPASLFRP